MSDGTGSPARFPGTVVLITGAGSGIGAATAARFAAEGARIVVADIDGDAARSVAAGIPSARAVTVDVTDRAGVRAVVAEVESVEGRVDVLINNAMTCAETPLLELSAAELERDIAVGITAAFHTVQAVLPGMIARHGGVILNMTSVNGIGYYGNEAYSAAKAALFSLTRSIAVRYGEHGIRCNGVAAGTIATPAWSHRVDVHPDILTTVTKWYPLGRVGTPDDIADALLFLASAQAAWITGTTLTVDGGLTAGNRLMTDEIVTPG
jgi:NAD(P)-dependent dehydrogenase (short-subunit alcohol dehydrogenase family)